MIKNKQTISNATTRMNLTNIRLSQRRRAMGHMAYGSSYLHIFLQKQPRGRPVITFPRGSERKSV